MINDSRSDFRSAIHHQSIRMKYARISWPKVRFVVSYIVVYGLKIIGLAPFSLSRSFACSGDAWSSDQSEPFRYSKLGSIYNFLIILPISLIPLENIFDTPGSEPRKPSMSSDINRGIFIFRQILNLTTTSLILVAWSLNQRKAAQTLNLILKTSARLSRLKHEPTKKWLMLSFAVHLAIQIVLWITFSVSAIDYGSLPRFVRSVLRSLPAIVILWFDLQYAVVVDFLAWKFQTVNHCLKNHEKFDRPPQFTVQTNRRNDRLAFVRLVRNVRATLIELCEDIGEFFSLPILFSLFTSFVAIFYDLYNIFINAYQPNEIYSDRNVIGTGYWTFLLITGFVYPIVTLTFSITRAVKEARLSRRIVNKLLAAEMKGSEIYTELEMFSRDLLHDNADVFTAYDVFSLDLTFLPTMLASSATYFVVLLQLRSPITDPQASCKCNHSQ